MVTRQLCYLRRKVRNRTSVARRWHEVMRVWVAVLLAFIAFAIFLNWEELRQLKCSPTTGTEVHCPECPVATPAPQEAKCSWRFVRYEPSPYELLWTENARQWADNVCEVLKKEEHMRAGKLIIRRVVQLTNSGYLSDEAKPLSKQEEKEADELMSKLHYSQFCRGGDNENGRDEEVIVEEGLQMIEPLWGFLRDPFDRFCNLSMAGWQADRSQSKAHILPLVQAPFATRRISVPQPSQEESTADQWRWVAGSLAPWWNESQRTGRPPRKVFIDLGSAYFRGWSKSIGAASGEWFYSMYHLKGFPFDHFLAVEISDINPEKAYEQLPKDLVGIYNLVNLPLSFDSKQSGDAYKLITNLVDKDDLLVMKLDVDSSALETAIPDRIMKDPQFAALFDEFMFEHHVSIPVMSRVWKARSDRTIVDSYNLFGELRRKGIRSHSWP